MSIPWINVCLGLVGSLRPFGTALNSLSLSHSLSHTNTRTYTCTHALTHTHTHTHSHTHNLSHTLFLAHSLFSLVFSLAPAPSLPPPPPPPPHTLPFSHTHTFSHSHTTVSLLLAHTLFLSCKPRALRMKLVSTTYLLSLSLSLSLFLTLYLPYTHALSLAGKIIEEPFGMTREYGPSATTRRITESGMLSTENLPLLRYCEQIKRDIEDIEMIW